MNSSGLWESILGVAETARQLSILHNGTKFLAKYISAVANGKRNRNGSIPTQYHGYFFHNVPPSE